MFNLCTYKIEVQQVGIDSRRKHKNIQNKNNPPIQLARYCRPLKLLVTHSKTTNNASLEERGHSSWRYPLV